MSENIPSLLAYQRKWWWDPIDMEIFKELEEEIQQRLIAVSLQTNAQVLRTQAEGLEKLAGVMAKTR